MLLLLLFEKTRLPRKKSLSFLSFSRSLSHHLLFGYLSQKSRLVPLKSITRPCSNLFDWPNVKLSVRIRYHKHKRLLAAATLATDSIVGTGSTGEGQNEGGTLRRQPVWWFWSQFRFGTELHNEPPETTGVALILVVIRFVLLLRQGAVTTVVAAELPPTKLRIIVETNAKSKLLVRR